MESIFNINNKVIGKFIQIHEILQSTNDEALKYTHSKLENDGLIIFADIQTDGRGQRNALWTSEKHQNLTASIVLFPHFLDLRKYFYLNMCISLAIVDYINENHQLDAKIKWPNDIFVQNKKVAGILIETSIQGKKFQSAVVGIGLNLNQQIYPPALIRAASLSTFSNKEYKPIDVLKDLAPYLDRYYLELKRGDFKALKKKYIKQLYLYKKPWIFYDNDRTKIEGQIVDINAQGQLIIQDIYENKHSFYFKEVSFY